MSCGCACLSGQRERSFRFREATPTLSNNELKDSTKPNLLILTSSFPNEPNDETCGYIRDFSRAVSSDFDVHVLAPADRLACEWPVDLFRLTRSKPPLPKSLDPFQASADFNSLLSLSVASKIAFVISFVFFFINAARLALRADAICSHWLAPSGIIGAILSLALRKPHVVVEHSGALHFLRRMRGGARLAGFIAARSHRIITVSEDLKRKLVALCPEAARKTEVIPMGVRLESRRDSAIRSGDHQIRPVKTALFIGRLTEVKGADVLIRAMQKIEGAQLLIAGEGAQRNALEALAKSLSVNAKFLGQIEAAERARLFSVCDAVAIPSRSLGDGRTEGTPVVCLEAMAAGCAVVASRVGGLAELIIEGQNGLLVEPDNHAMLAERLEFVLADEKLRQWLSENAQLAATRYAWAKLGARFAGIIKGSLRKNAIYND
jgi:glycosyltransferase involved in cell wall biosynthesis